MTEDVKPHRTYNSRRRREQAEQTRRDVLAAAGVLFRDRGYAAAQMPAIAAEAGVAVETVYRAFGSKATLFKAVVEAALAGGAARAAVPVERRPAIRAVIEEQDPRRKVARYAATQPGIHRRAGPLMRALREGAGTDPELRQLWDEMETRRYEGQGRLVDELGTLGALRPGLDVDAGKALIWTLCSVAVHDALVIDRGWTDEHYGEWLAATLVEQLVGPD
jgi:AcrR family transcriptional regulator